MSELIQKNDNRATIRWKLLTSASAAALIASAFGASEALAADGDAARPQVWIELGGQLSILEAGQENFLPSAMDARPSIFAPSAKFDGQSKFGFDETGKITFQPDNSDWVFSGSIRYGRSANKRHVRQQLLHQTHLLYFTVAGNTYVSRFVPFAAKFADTRADNSEQHAILDFQAGKDVGLGMFGAKNGSSVVNVGVRFAQFRSKSNIALQSDPDWQFVYAYYPSYISIYNATNTKVVRQQHFHTNLASLRASRSFHGVGPSISWNASMPFAGNTRDGELDVDWGVNAALLFGRQKTKTVHHTTVYYGTGYFTPHRVMISQRGPYPHTRSRDVTVPNVGGFAGLSYKYADAKISFGYKADFFFGAIDGGIDTRKNENRAFYGPYASISFGLGD